MAVAKYTTSQLLGDLDTNQDRAQRLVRDLARDVGHRRPAPHKWSIAECLEHIALTNHALVHAMHEAASGPPSSLGGGSQIEPSRLARTLLWLMEPPVRWVRIKSHPTVRPTNRVDLATSVRDLAQSHVDLARLLQGLSSIDLNRLTFADLFNPRARHTIGVGALIIAAHERRHLWQAEGIRRALFTV